MKLQLEMPTEYGYENNNKLEIDVTYIAEGMLNIMVNGKAPDEIEIEIIAENAKFIQESVMWDIREKETNLHPVMDGIIKEWQRIYNAG